MFLVFVLFSVLATEAVNITVVGGPTFFPFLKTWADAYTLLVPTFHLNVELSTNVNGVAQISTGTDANGNQIGNKSVDLVLSDGVAPSVQAQDTVGLQCIPMLATTVVAQVNFAFNQDIFLTREVMSEIYMGSITQWNDSKITVLNPHLPMPNATINVYYYDVTPFNNFWMIALSLWNKNFTYPPNAYWPDALRAKSNFYLSETPLAMNGAVAGAVNSIGVVQYWAVKRDNGLFYAHWDNKFSGSEVTPDSLLNPAYKFVVLDARLDPHGVIDPPDNYSWPIVSMMGMVVHKKPTGCERSKALYRFLRWAFTAKFPRSATVQGGCIPIDQNLTHAALKALEAIECNGESIGAPTETGTRGAIDIFLFTISILVLAAAIFLSAFHVFNFRSSKILLVYTSIFVIGIILTLISPIFWWFKPTNNSICQARIWTLSLGFSIILGTMFSKTWQLQEIYYLQKGGMEAITRRISTNKTYIQLAGTLLGSIFINMIILIAWSASDPLKSSFYLADDVNYSGYWTCKSNNIAPWLIVELIFFLFLLCFGVYVIYDTWSFQRAVVLTETRWVLFALYNVILNVFAISPFIALVSIDDRTLGLLAIASIDLSAGSVACAVLLPRLITDFKNSKSGSGGKDSNKAKSNLSNTVKDQSQGRSPRAESIHIEQPGKAKVRKSSWTPEEELVKRLTNPTPMEGSELDPSGHPLDHPLDPSGHPVNTTIEEPDSPQEVLSLVQEHPETEIEMQGMEGHTTDSLKWSKNPITTINET